MVSKVEKELMVARSEEKEESELGEMWLMEEELQFEMVFEQSREK